jgi:hypothetical protein
VVKFLFNRESRREDNSQQGKKIGYGKNKIGWDIKQALNVI